MVFLVAALVGAVFGAADQYLGSLHALGLWTVSASLLSAPWLFLPFVVGCSQPRWTRAAAVGLVATLCALAGYFVMVMGPFEGGHSSFDLRELHGLLVSNARNIVGGLLTAPLYGALGQRWRTRRSWMSATLTAGAFCLEPLAQLLTGHRYPGESSVWPAEIALGLALGGYFLAAGLAFRRPGSYPPP